ncbi:MAG TPA: hypothetical protein VE713_11345 [Pyrinomonadaceae bacterium]|nr:hypothetical protein [Pyrinomonadaceae bacterium]
MKKLAVTILFLAAACAAATAQPAAHAEGRRHRGPRRPSRS